MSLKVLGGTSHRALADAVAAALGGVAAEGRTARFPDGELHPVVGPVRGDDVYVVQPTGPPVNDHLVELLLLLDACRRAGARRVTAVVPYLGYARQDRRGRPGEAVGARVVVEAMVASGAQRLVVVDPHTPAIEGMCSAPVEMLTAVPLLAASLRPVVVEHDAVVVAPDLGAVKLAERYAAVLDLPVAVVRKTRLSGSVVRADEVVGDVAARLAVVVDDMISTGGTVEAATRAVLEAGARRGVVVVATHGLLVGDACERLARAGVGRLLVTDSVPVAGVPLASGGLSPEVHGLATFVADAVGRLHRNEDLAELLARV